jgi:hypothetical protein
MTKSTLLLVALAIIAAGVGLFIHNQRQSAWNSPEPAMTEPWLGEFDVNAVESVVVKTNSDTVTLRKTRAGWTVAERGDYPADFLLVGNLVRGLRDLRPAQIVKAGPSRHAGLELLEPDGSTDGSGTLVEFLDGEGKRLAALIVGKQSMARDPSGVMPPVPNGRFVRRPGDTMEVGLVDDPLAGVRTSPAGWLDRDFLVLEGINSIAVDAPGISWRIKRQAVATPWELEDASDGETANQSAIDPMAALLGNLSFIDVGEGGDAGFERTATITVGMVDGPAVVLEAGDREGEYYPVIIRVDAGGDDAEGSKAAEMKRFEGRIFHLPANLVATVLKPRDALAKRPVPPPSPSPAQGGGSGEAGNGDQ